MFGLVLWVGCVGCWLISGSVFVFDPLPSLFHKIFFRAGEVHAFPLSNSFQCVVSLLLFLLFDVVVVVVADINNSLKNLARGHISRAGVEPMDWYSRHRNSISVWTAKPEYKSRAHALFFSRSALRWVSVSWSGQARPRSVSFFICGLLDFYFDFESDSIFVLFSLFLGKAKINNLQ